MRPSYDGALIVQGDALRLPLLDESVDLVVTSPPYFALRAYDAGPAQVGSELTPQAYLETLWAATAEMVRVLKPSGSIFVDLGDKYGDKSLMLLPERYRIGCVDQLGLIARAVIVWGKSGLPQPVTDRVRRSHEDWVHLTKQPRYYSAIDEVREPYHPDTLRPTKYGAHNWDQRRSARNMSGGDGTAFRPNPLGKPPGSVWMIPTEPLRLPDHLGVDHYAAFPSEWPRRLILGWSPPDGTVLDPFSGTGTAIMVASKLGRFGIGVDLSHNYCRVARWRVRYDGAKAEARTNGERQETLAL